MDCKIENKKITAPPRPRVRQTPDKEIFRCPWCLTDPLYTRYHDDEWGKFCADDQRIFEFITLEAAQAGLSWFTILKKREGYRAAFAGFDPVKVANFTNADIERLVLDAGIVRCRAKIVAAIRNAQVFLEIAKERGSFADYLLDFFPQRKPIVNKVGRLEDIPASTPLSGRIAVDLKKRGLKFFGPTICYAHLQATGFVNDHLDACAFKPK